MDKNAQDQDQREALKRVLDRLPVEAIQRIWERIEPVARIFLRGERVWKN